MKDVNRWRQAQNPHNETQDDRSLEMKLLDSYLNNSKHQHSSERDTEVYEGEYTDTMVRLLENIMV